MTKEKKTPKDEDERWRNTAQSATRSFVRLVDPRVNFAVWLGKGTRMVSNVM